MGKSIVKNITLVSPKASRMYLTPINQAGSKLSKYVGGATVDNVSVVQALIVESAYSSGATISNVASSQQIISVDQIIDTSYIFNATVGGVAVESDNSISSKYVGGATISSIDTDSLLQSPDDTPPTNVIGQWTIENTFVSANVIEITLGGLATDNDTPDGNLGYGLIAESSFGAVADAQNLGRDYTGFKDVKTGAELAVNGRKLIWDNAFEEEVYRVSVVVWDSQNNTASYDIITVETVVLDITDFYIEQSAVTLAIDETVQLSVFIAGDGYVNEVEWESLDPSVIFHQGDGVFVGVGPGQTGLRVKLVQDESILDTISGSVVDYQTINEGQHSSFETGPINFIDTLYRRGATIDDVQLVSIVEEIIDTSYSFGATVGNVAVSSNVLDEIAENGFMTEYVLNPGGSDDGRMIEYRTEGITTVSYISGATIDNVSALSIVQDKIVETSYSAGATISSILIESIVAETFGAVEGEDNGRMTEYVLTESQPDDGRMIEYETSIKPTSYSAGATIDNLSIVESQQPITLIIESEYISAGATVDNISIDLNALPLVVESKYEKGATTDNAESNQVVQPINLVVTTSYSAGATIDNLSIESTIV